MYRAARPPIRARGTTTTVRQDRAQVDHARRHPHEQPADLLVEPVGEPPLLVNQAHQLRRTTAGGVERADGDRRERDVDPQQAAPDAARKQVRRRDVRRHPPPQLRRETRATRMRRRPRRVSRFECANDRRAAASRAVQSAGDVPEPHRADAARATRARWCRAAALARCRRAGDSRRRRPGQDRAQRHDQQQQQVLHHVGAERIPAGQDGQWRSKCQQKRGGRDYEARNLPRRDRRPAPPASTRTSRPGRSPMPASASTRVPISLANSSS